MTRRSRVLAIVVLSAAALVMALTAPLASATRITTGGDPFSVSLKSMTTARFVAENAFATTSIRCEKSSTGGTLPTQVPSTQNNTNRTGTGTESAGPGVTVDLNKPRS